MSANLTRPQLQKAKRSKGDEHQVQKRILMQLKNLDLVIHLNLLLIHLSNKYTQFSLYRKLKVIQLLKINPRDINSHK